MYDFLQVLQFVIRGFGFFMSAYLSKFFELYV